MLEDVKHMNVPSGWDVAAIVEASDIPILSSTDRLQSALLRWIDLCGLSGQYHVQNDILATLKDNMFLDERSFVLDVYSEDINTWSIIWTGSMVSLSEGDMFAEALVECIPDQRFVNLVAQEYMDAVQYRRASARRFSHRNERSSNTMDKLIFPLRDNDQAQYLLVVGEPVEGKSLFNTEGAI